ncbi:HEPN/Toprim-associated domain-containing protein [Paraburkholderia bannensis]|uniref:HEPN/Toprim-associated domain-containing protein n=1 Tax=Paraburkholderia bannensis TaxID=765414 RepID=UPI002AB2E007|nr:HEPN/Toprim-associated domain-containing protein [Paraburkholderia bannensis]
MTFHRAYTLVDGYPFHWSLDDYPWLFENDDRVVRTRLKSQRNTTIHKLPEDPAELNQTEAEYLYVTTAAVMRRRLNRDFGYNRWGLQAEFDRYKKVMIELDPPEFHCGENPSEIRPMPQRAEILRNTTLNDWLAALKEVVRSGLTGMDGQENLSAPEILDCRLKEMVETIICDDFILGYNINPEHPLRGFPCRDFGYFAVAILEVVPDTAECALDITELVKNGKTDQFNDLIQANKRSEPD